MSIRRFCDLCGVEIERNYVAERFQPWKWFTSGAGGINVTVELAVRIGETWNKGDACLPCIRSVVTEGKEIGR